MPDQTGPERRTGGAGSFSRRLLLGGLGGAGVAAAAGAYALSRTEVGLEPGRARARPVIGAAKPPSTVEVVVIGGGVIGTAAALALAERGVSVALCEKGVIAGEASGRAMGYVYSQYADPAKFALLSRACDLWAGMNARTGLDTGYRKTGVVGPLDSDAQAAQAESWLGSLHGTPGVTGRILTQAQLMRLFPAMSDPPRAGLLTDTDASVEPTLAAPAMAEAAQRNGAVILQGCAARGLETAAGRISGVVTEKGVIACQAVVLAGGAWTPLFAGSVGVTVAQVEMYLSMMGLTPVPGPTVSLSAPDYGFRRQVDGGYSLGVIDLAAPLEPQLIKAGPALIPSIQAFLPMAHLGFSPKEFWNQLQTPSHWPLDRPSPFEARRILMPRFRPEPLDRALGALRRHFPVFDQAAVRERWAGVMSVSLDNMPILSAAPGRSGLFVGSGFADGMTFAPAAGEALADLVMGRTPVVDLHGYRLGRFSDGSPITYHG